jgi:hypothetical protein
MKLAFIACDHGFGHTKRIIKVIKYLSLDPSLSIDLFASTKIVNNLVFNDYTTIRLNVNIKNFETRTTLDHKFFSNPFEWLTRLPDLNVYDKVISDNLIELLSIRNDAIISGSFFWHYSCNMFSTKDYDFLENLLYLYKPMVIGLDGFSKNLRLNTNINLVHSGFVIEDFLREPKYDHKKGILLTGGKSKKIDNLFLDIIVRLFDEERLNGYNFWIDSNIPLRLRNKRLRKATFDIDMFDGLIAAIARPGIGIITESVQYGFMIFPVFELGNNEMKSNSDSLFKFGIGFKYDNLIEDLVGYLNSRVEVKKYYAKIDNLNKNGLDDYKKFILN